MQHHRTVVCLFVLSTAAAAAAAAAAACGGARMPSSPTPALAGRWQGTIDSASDHEGTITLELTQTGLDFTGTARMSQDGILDVPGVVSGTLSAGSTAPAMQLTITYEYGAACHGAFTGTYNVNGRQMEGEYAGQNCVRAYTGLLRVSKID